MIRPSTKVALVLGAALAVSAIGWGIEWAYYAMGAQWFWACFWTAAVLAVVMAFCVWLIFRLTPGSGGKHADRGDEWVPPWAGMAKPAEVASEPPAEFYAAAPVAAPCDLPAWAVQDEDAGPVATCPHGWPGSDCSSAHPYLSEPGAAARASHDEYAPDQVYDGHASAPDLILTPYLAVAYAAAATLKGLTERAIVAEARAVPFKRWESDTYVGGIPVVLDDDGLVAAMDAETAAGAR